MALQVENGRYQRQQLQRAVSGGLKSQPRHVPTARPAYLRAERLLQISLAALTSLGTLLLGMGERNVTLPVLAVIVSVSSVYLTDIKGWLQLNTFVANVAGLIALAVTWRDWNNYAAEGQLLSLANLLIYLQFVLLYRKKSMRNYWLLLLLSLLQVAVAAALNMSVSFGVLLPAYMFVGLITMALFVVYREQLEHESPSFAGVEQSATRFLPPAVGSPRRWPLAAQAAAFEGWQPTGAADRGLGWSFLRQILWLGTATLLFSLVWFFGLPRAGKKGPWRPAGVLSYTTVGFSESVTLGQLGEVYENPEEVMQVTFRDYASDESYRIGGDTPLFRGSVLYEYRRGRWHPLRTFRSQAATLKVTAPEELPTNNNLVREKVTIRGRPDGVLFTVWPAYSTVPSDLKYAPTTEQLLRSKNLGEPLSYELVTTAFRDHIPQLSIPAERPPDKAALAMPTSGGADTMAGLRAEAARIVDDVSADQPARIAQALEGYLRDRGEFQYSLKPVRRSQGVDPVEDFVTDHRSGHCEYFASALTLMLRSLNIPARLAIGFKGGEWNAAGQYYQVRELHAHAWVEAYVPPDSLPNNLANDKKARQNGAWLILDPTPRRSEEDDLADRFGIGAVKRLLDLTQLVWTNYVLGMDSQRQQEAIYQPLIQRLEETLQGLTEEEGRQRIRQWLTDFANRRLGLSHGLFSWQGLLTSMVALLLLIGVGKMAQAVAIRLRRWLARRPAARRRAARRVEFYEQFENLLARYGMPRMQNQTQREFALATGGHLAESPLTQPSSPLPRRIADAYYRVRFGRRELDNTELRSVEKAIADLAAALAARHGSG